MVDINKEDLFRSLPQRRLTDAEKQFIQIKIERSKLNRERSILILDKGLLLFFAFLMLGIIGFLNHMIDQMMLNSLIIAGLVVLFLSIFPYSSISKKSEKELEDILHSLTGK